MTEREKVFSKIRKLLSLSNSPVQAEAEEAARKAHALLLKYNLSMQDVSGEVPEVKEEVYSDGYRRKKWRNALLTAIADVNFCAMVTHCYEDGYYRYMLVGKEHNIQAAKWMGEYLVGVVERISRREIPKNAKAKYREDFRYGMAMGIARNLRDLKQQDAVAPESRALVVTEGKLVEEHLKKSGVEHKSLTGPSKSNAFLRGLVEGLKVPLDTQIGQTAS